MSLRAYLATVSVPETTMMMRQLGPEKLARFWNMVKHHRIDIDLTADNRIVSMFESMFLSGTAEDGERLKPELQPTGSTVCQVGPHFIGFEDMKHLVVNWLFCDSRVKSELDSVKATSRLIDCIPVMLVPVSLDSGIGMAMRVIAVHLNPRLSRYARQHADASQKAVQPLQEIKELPTMMAFFTTMLALMNCHDETMPDHTAWRMMLAFLTSTSGNVAIVRSGFAYTVSEYARVLKIRGLQTLRSYHDEQFRRDVRKNNKYDGTDHLLMNFWLDLLDDIRLFTGRLVQSACEASWCSVKSQSVMWTGHSVQILSVRQAQALYAEAGVYNTFEPPNTSDIWLIHGCRMVDFNYLVDEVCESIRNHVFVAFECTLGCVVSSSRMARFCLSFRAPLHAMLAATPLKNGLSNGVRHHEVQTMGPGQYEMQKLAVADSLSYMILSASTASCTSLAVGSLLLAIGNPVKGSDITTLVARCFQLCTQFPAEHVNRIVDAIGNYMHQDTVSESAKLLAFSNPTLASMNSAFAKYARCGPLDFGNPGISTTLPESILSDSWVLEKVEDSKKRRYACGIRAGIVSMICGPKVAITQWFADSEPVLFCNPSSSFDPDVVRLGDRVVVPELKTGTSSLYSPLLRMVLREPREQWVLGNYGLVNT